RLRRDDADRLTHVHGRTAGEIAPVALAAHAAGQVAGEHRTVAHFLHARLADRLDLLLLHQRAARDDDLRARRIAHVLRRGAAENAAAERGHDLARVDDGPHLDAAARTAVLGGDDAVLRHVDETTRQIAGVGRL